MNGKIIGKPKENGGLMGFNGIYPTWLFNKLAIENDHRNSGYNPITNSDFL